jgi:hypothetical protein
VWLVDRQNINTRRIINSTIIVCRINPVSPRTHTRSPLQYEKTNKGRSTRSEIRSGANKSIICWVLFSHDCVRQTSFFLRSTAPTQLSLVALFSYNTMFIFTITDLLPIPYFQLYITFLFFHLYIILYKYFPIFLNFTALVQFITTWTLHLHKR